MRDIEAAGMKTLLGIADALNAQGVRTARRGQWYPATVRNLKLREASLAGEETRAA